MKTMNQQSNPSIIAKTLAVLTCFTLMTACSDEESPEATLTISSEETAEIVGASLAGDAKGLTATLEESAQDAQELTRETVGNGRTDGITSCGLDSTATFTVTNPLDLGLNFDYALSYTYVLTCNQFNIPTEMDFSFTQSGEVDAPRYRSNTNGNGNWNLSGLEIAATEYALNGTYSSAGSHESLIRNRSTFDFDLDMTLSDLTLNKGNYQITGGSADFSMSGTNISDESFSVTGSIVYLGDGIVSITVNEDTYRIDLNTGEIIE